jgi:hypothetical protein
MDSHRIGKVAPLFFISVVCLFCCSAFATPMFEIGTNVAGEVGSVAFVSEIVGGPSRSGYVDYKVYYPQAYTGALDAVEGDHFVYAYQVFNDSTSDLSIESFIVSLKYGGVVGSIGYASGGGINPWITSPSGSESAAYFFYLNAIGAEDNSSVLWFSNASGPIAGSATVNGSDKFVEVDGVMVPVPEPVSCLLFGVSGVYLAFSRRRKAS